jgi:hypothetical protein
MTARKHLSIAGAYLLLLLSPVGGPVVGIAIQTFCGNDNAADADGIIPTAYCGINRPAERLYQSTAVLSFLPTVFVGPFLGVLLSLIWWCIGAATVAGFIRSLWRAFAVVTIDRL